ncbi:MAG TPA: MoaD/ThiS family protein [Acidimicrobiia bacterium]|jgi:molybdopterin synthase catalytic subunit/molybdopterin synthase sulfur carrier subunit|nr:MoaD/ThiS family protein [Acidimicrobiia bacterium]
MAKLRLFASLREIAGTSHLEVPAATVGEAIEAVNDKFGPDFARGVETARIWVNGEEASMGDQVVETDELVILPPVSGGGQPATLAATDLAGLLPLVVAGVVVLANLRSQPIWAAALVAVAAAWAVDMGTTFGYRARVFAPLAVVTAAAVSTLAAHILGDLGYGLAVPLAVAVGLGWAVAFPEYRAVGAFAPTVLVGLIGGVGAASLILTRSSFSPDPQAIDVFLAATIVGVLVGSVVGRLPAVPFLDRFTTTAITTVLAAMGAAAMWDLDVVGYLLVGLGLAVALVAGQGLSSMLRTGSVLLAERPPGFLAAVDGIALAAAIYFPLIRLVLSPAG